MVIEFTPASGAVEAATIIVVSVIVVAVVADILETVLSLEVAIIVAIE